MSRVAASELYADLHALNRLKYRAGQDARAALPEVAKQFESLYVQMAMKSMRQAGAPQESGLFDSEQSRFYRDMHDQQMALHLARQGGFGLAKTLERQLGGGSGVPAGEAAAGKDLDAYRRTSPRGAAGAKGSEEKASTPDAVRASRRPGRPEPLFASRKEFIHRLMPLAESAAAELGVSPSVLLAQAALETGWGRSVIRKGDGSSSFNLFCIKAGSQWEGKRAGVVSLEYDQGVAVRRAASFRAYDSYEESFGDYVRFLRENPRYAAALARADDPAAYARELQKAGYATDPHYANKILAIARRADSLYDASAPLVAEAGAPETRG
jgi:flagellar protein FlgJ